jgi:predicted  nucleic acid-binding Zn-ribbon protein
VDLEEQLKEKTDLEEISRRVINNLNRELKSYKRTVKHIQPLYQEALVERSRFQKDAEKVSIELAASKGEAGKLSARIAELEQSLVDTKGTLTNSADVNVAKLAQAEARLEETMKKLASVDKRIQNANDDMEYARNAYQTASQRASDLDIEKRELLAKIEDLERRASDNIVKIHQINAQTQAEDLMRMVDYFRVSTREREREVDRLRDELRGLKNGRRETRQASVPRSPRMGMMSPRTGRGFGGSGSRGTSPAAPGFDNAGPPVISGMSLFNQPPGNGRWGHLRD